MIALAKAAGMITTVHTGGSSIPGSSAIRAEHLVAMQPHVSFHVNGGPTAVPDEDFGVIIEKTGAALQVCTAGNLRTTILCANLARDMDVFDRFIIATDTPTGSGIMPLGMLYTISHCASLTDMPAECFICAATGSNARVYRLNSGLLTAGMRRRYHPDRRPQRRFEKYGARCDQKRRRAGGERCHDRRHAAIRRAKPQHAGRDTRGSRRLEPHPRRLCWLM